MITDLNKANLVLGEMSTLEQHIAMIGADRDESIRRLQAATEASFAPRYARLRELQGQLTEFAEFNREVLFRTKQTVTVSFGSFGFKRKQFWFKTNKQTEVQP